MNKTISYITSLVTVVGLGTAWAFGKIDATGFSAISIAVLGAIYGLYQKFEKGKAVKLVNKLTEDLLDSENERKNLLDSNVVISKQCQEAINQVQTLKVNQYTLPEALSTSPIWVTMEDAVEKKTTRKPRKK